jgi:nucleotide-binding universal stress UspA family protein
MTLVVGYDGTDGARASLDEALRLAADLGTGVHVVFAYERSNLPTEMRDLDEAVMERATAVLGQASEIAQAAGVAVETEVLQGGVAATLLQAAETHDARYIVVGSYGERPLKSALVGSTPSRLLHLSERPVLVVRAPES